MLLGCFLEIKSVCDWHAKFFDFTQGILTGNLSKQQGENLFPSCEMLAISVSSGLFYDFFKTISENEVEKLRIDAIVIHYSGLAC